MPSWFNYISLFCNLDFFLRLTGIGFVALLSGSGTIHGEAESCSRVGKREAHQLVACKRGVYRLTCLLCGHYFTCFCGEYRKNCGCTEPALLPLLSHS